MIVNLFSYPSNFGKLKIYKCDFYGNALSLERPCFVNDFSAKVEQNPEVDELLFGSPNMSQSFQLRNREINISSTFLFSNDLSGVLDPGIDLLFNLSEWSYQGTNVSYKFSLSAVSSTQLTYSELIVGNGIGLTAANYLMFKFYLVNATTSVKLTPSSVDPTTGIITYSSVTVPSGCWLEVFKYGNLTSLVSYPTRLEPMFRIDSSEGSFFPCMINKVTFSMESDFIKVSCDIVSVNYDRSTRYGFVNSSSPEISAFVLKPMHESRIIIQDYTNDITGTFSISDLSSLEYMDGLLTQSFSASPIENFSITIDNGLKPVYRNIYAHIKRTYVGGYYSQNRKIGGTMSVLALRSSQPTFDRYPVLSGVSGKSLSVIFGNQRFTIPYTLWNPGNIISKQGDYTKLTFNWSMVTKDRDSQPIFELYGALI